ncbi:uncharacterized protein LOC135226877 [Macrobrachium nipponense]|uniref:uncharacterized protein LOC135226877 n=1 Tax=Macrobrachium nipponense TaxID=159736 RepID=UPI0030C7E986
MGCTFHVWLKASRDGEFLVRKVCDEHVYHIPDKQRKLPDVKEEPEPQRMSPEYIMEKPEPQRMLPDVKEEPEPQKMFPYLMGETEPQRMLPEDIKEDIKEETEPMLSMEANEEIVQNHIMQTTRKKCILKNLSNIASGQTQLPPGKTDLEGLVDKMKKYEDQVYKKRNLPKFQV